MIEKLSVIDRIEIERDGTVFARIHCQTTDSGMPVKIDLHDLTIGPKDDPAGECALATKLMQERDFAPLDAKDISRLVALCTILRSVGH
jgi:hypothetical protein